MFQQQNGLIDPKEVPLSHWLVLADEMQDWHLKKVQMHYYCWFSFQSALHFLQKERKAKPMDFDSGQNWLQRPKIVAWKSTMPVDFIAECPCSWVPRMSWKLLLEMINFKSSRLSFELHPKESECVCKRSTLEMTKQKQCLSDCSKMIHLLQFRNTTDSKTNFNI